MRAKKPKQRPGSIRYLLSLDRTLQRVSLRKIVERVKPAKKRPQARAATKPAKASTRRTQAARQWSIDPRTIVFGSVCVLAAAALIAARQPSSTARLAEVDRTQQIDRTQPVAALTTAGAMPPAAGATTPAPLSARTTTAPVSMSEPIAPPLPNASATTEAAPMAAAPPRSEAAEAGHATTAPLASTVEDESTAPVTITGCLERNDHTFWLKDASGAGAPKGRSWRSGFLRKRSSPVELIDRARAFELASHVGQRVETTGVLVDREMRVRSLRVQGSCD